jgi:type II secretory ATPase GspE/PulE/Tfp pilus assembly ATPase PilB-like protein
LSIGEAAAGVRTPGFSVTDYFSPTDNVYAGKGCNVCSQSGYQGRTALFEMIEVTPEIQELLLHSPSTQEIEKIARAQGSKPMFDDGIAKVKRGITSLAEVLRVVPPPKSEKTPPKAGPAEHPEHQAPQERREHARHE